VVSQLVCLRWHNVSLWPMTLKCNKLYKFYKFSFKSLQRVWSYNLHNISTAWCLIMSAFDPRPEKCQQVHAALMAYLFHCFTHPCVKQKRGSAHQQEVQLWQRDYAKLDTFSINVQRYSPKSCTKLDFWATLWGHQEQYMRFIWYSENIFASSHN